MKTFQKSTVTFLGKFLCTAFAFALLLVFAGDGIAVPKDGPPGTETVDPVVEPVELFEDTIVGITNIFTTVETRGVMGYHTPWEGDGIAILHSDGNLEVVVEGLVKATEDLAGATGSVTYVRASISCEGKSEPLVTTNLFRLDAGVATIEEPVDLDLLPPTCVAPIVFVQDGGTLDDPIDNGPWIAATGFSY